MLIMQSIKLNLNVSNLFLSIILIVTYGCGSFSSSSLVSADGIYSSKKIKEIENSSTKYYENYFKEKALELENGFVFSDSINASSDFVTSNDIIYSSNQAAWGDIPDTIDYVVDDFPYRNRYFGYGYYGGMSPYYGNWYGGYSYFSMRSWYRYGWMYGYYPLYYDYYPYFWWGRTMRFNYGNRYSKYGSYNNSVYNNYLSRNSTENISYNQGKRGSSKGVVVYGNGNSTSANLNSSDVTSVTSYNVGRSSALEDNNATGDKNIKFRSYKDFVRDNSSTRNNIERNRIYSKPEMGVGVSNSVSKARSSGNDVSRRYYSNPTNSLSRGPAKSTQYNWGLGGRNNYSGNSSSKGVRGYANPSSGSSSSRSYSSPSSSNSSFSRPTSSSSTNSSSSARGSSSVGSSGRGSR